MISTTLPSLFRILAGSVALWTEAIPPVAQPTDSVYHVSREIRLGGEGRWDYVTLDSAGHRLFIARQTRVMVVDPETGRLLGEIPGLNGAHGVALAYPTGHGFATSGRDSSVTMFDLKTLKVLRRSRAGDDADGVLYDPASKRVFTFNGDANSSTAIDPGSGQILGTMRLGGKPEFGVSNGTGRLYVNLEDKAEMVEIDPARLRVTRRWPLGPCEEPTGLAIDRGHHLLFSGCHNKLMAISDAAAGRKRSPSAEELMARHSTQAPGWPLRPTEMAPSRWSTRTAPRHSIWCPTSPRAGARVRWRWMSAHTVCTPSPRPSARRRHRRLRSRTPAPIWLLAPSRCWC
jgi:hypothetical protein